MMDVSPVLIWFLIGTACFVTELALPSFFLFFFGIGAWCASAAAAALNLPLTVQIAVFLVCSICSLILLRAKFRSVFVGEAKEKEAADRLISATGIVTEAITPPSEGRIQYKGSFWRAVADEHVEVGETVRIVEDKNLVIKVRAIKKDKEETKWESE